MKQSEKDEQGEVVKVLYAIFNVSCIFQMRCDCLSISFIGSWISKSLFNIYGQVSKTLMHEDFMLGAVGCWGAAVLGFSQLFR